ncbi:MAG: hypothetical protein CMJ78_04710 [Planctomycetaceae bacterium]|nr:hypothetical protein [Planctomycetaceae bacterium]
MTETEIEQLQQHTEKRQWRDVSTMIEKHQRRKLDGSVFEVLEPLLTVTEYAIFKTAINMVGKLKNPPAPAFSAVLNAWQNTWTFGCPQCTPEALKALLSLDANNSAIVTEIKRCLEIDNYQIHKACADALLKIDTTEARQVLQDFESFLPRAYTEKVMVDLLAKIRALANV